MDCDSLHLDLSSLSWESVWQTQCEEKAWLTVVCLTVLLCTLYTCIGCSSLTVSSKISAWHVPVCESVWLQSPIRDCFTYCCQQCYRHGGGIMENDYTHATSKSEGRWRKDFTNGFHMKTATMLWTSLHCHRLRLNILISKRTPH